MKYFKQIAVVILLMSAFMPAISVAGDELVVADIKDRIDADENLVLIDIRDKDLILSDGTLDYYANNIISMRELISSEKISLLSKDFELVVYTGSEEEQEIAIKEIKRNGFKNVSSILDGYNKLVNAGLRIKSYDNYVGSPLYNKPQKINDDVYVFIGETTPPSYYNYGHNNNISFVIDDEFVTVFNAGGSALLARAVHEEIKSITAKPVLYVALENAQAHASLGSSYWRENGAKIIASKATNDLLISSAPMMSRARSRLGDHFFQTEVPKADIIFEKSFKIPNSVHKLELMWIAEAHGLDDIAMWMPNRKIVMAGDYLFNQRMLPIASTTNIGSWIESIEYIRGLDPKIIIPGHGDVTDMNTADIYTKDYLLYIKSEIESILDEGGDMIDIDSIDTKEFRPFKLYKLINKQNLSRLFTKMEFE